MTYITEEIKQVANKMIDEYLDWAEVSGLPYDHFLAAYNDGVWIVDANDSVSFEEFVKVECVTDKTWM